ncbi:hypothetical protein D3C87_1641150 [compost metagenome]
MIKDILKEREAKIIAETKKQFEALNKIHQKRGDQESLLETNRLEELGQMISLAQFALGFVIGQSDKESLEYWTEEAIRAQGE